MENRERIAELARRAAKGSQQAFNELYLLTRDRAYFVAFSITKDEQDALDILQESYLKAWQGIDAMQKPEQFPAWLNQITGNTAKDFIKQRKPYLFQPVGEDEINPLDLQEEKDREYVPDAAMDTAETRRLVMEIVDGLPEDQRLCVLLYYYDDMPLKEIAASIGIPYSTVMSRLALARKKISSGVEALAKNGTRLYSAAPMPLFIWLLKHLAAESGKSLPPVILGTAAAGGAAATGGVLAAITLPKIIATVAAVAVIGGGAVAGTTIARRRQAQPAVAETTAVAAPQFTDAVPFAFPAVPVAYSLPTTPQTVPSDTVRPAAGNAAAAAQATSSVVVPTTAQAATTTTAAATTTTTAATTATPSTTTTTATAAKTTTTTTTTTPKPPVTGAITTDRVIYQLFVKIYPTEFPQDDLWQSKHFKPGSSYSLMAADLMAFSETVFPRIYTGNGSHVDLSAVETAQQENRLVSWAQGVAAQGDRIYTKHLSQVGLSYWNSELRPKLATFANLSYYNETVVISAYTSDDWARFQNDPKFPKVSELTLDGLIDYHTQLRAYFGVTDPIPMGDPTEP